MLLMLWFWTGCLDNCSAKALYVATIFFPFLMGTNYSGYLYNTPTFDMDLFACLVLRFLFRLLTALQISFMKVAYNGTFSCHLLTPWKYEWFHIYRFLFIVNRSLICYYGGIYFCGPLQERCIVHPIGSAVDYRQMGSVCYQLLQATSSPWFLAPFPYLVIWYLWTDIWAGWARFLFRRKTLQYASETEAPVFNWRWGTQPTDCWSNYGTEITGMDVW
jgi:hypothetical protein